jgi:alpha-acetolactate decarboxylase
MFFHSIMVKGWFSFLTQLVIKRDDTKLVSSVQKENPAATIETSCDFIAGILLSAVFKAF